MISRITGTPSLRRSLWECFLHLRENLLHSHLLTKAHQFNLNHYHIKNAAYLIIAQQQLSLSQALNPCQSHWIFQTPPLLWPPIILHLFSKPKRAGWVPCSIILWKRTSSCLEVKEVLAVHLMGAVLRSAMAERSNKKKWVFKATSQMG